MNFLKKTLAVIMIMIMALAVTGCHEKGEIAVTIEDIEFTSAYYMCALMNADSTAKAMVQEAKSAEEQTEEIDYYSEKIEGKKFVNWVEDTAVDNLKKIAAYKLLCKEAKIELSEEEITNAESYASYYWNDYGYSAYYTINGVGQETYYQYVKDAYLSGLYFEHIYGKDGEKEVAADKVAEAIYKDFIIANVLQISFADKSETEIESLKTKAEGYRADLANGKKTFEEIYKAEQQSEEEVTETTEPAPKDKYASIIGREGTQYEFSEFDEINSMNVGEVKLITLENDEGLLLVKKGDIKADPYYLDYLDLTGRHAVVDEEYEKMITDYANKLKADVNDYAVGQFKVKKIKEPEA